MAWLFAVMVRPIAALFLPAGYRLRVMGENLANKGGRDAEVSVQSLETTEVPGLLVARAPQTRPLGGLPESCGRDKINETVPPGRFGRILAGGQDAKTEILDKISLNS